MMKRRIQVLAVVLSILLMSAPVWAFVPTGELNAGIGAQWDREEKKLVHDSTRTGFRFVLEDSLDFGAKLHFSTQGWWDWKARKGDLGLDQLWLSGYKGDFDYQVGRQAISWGTADGFNPTNYFARMGTDSLLNGAISGSPVWAAQATYFGSAWSVTGVVVPFFNPQAIDDQMKQMMTEANPQAALLLKAIEDTKKPRGLGTNSEWAVRAETQVAGFDVQASIYSGFEPLPGMEMVLTVQPDLGPVPSFEGIYRRQTFAGLAVAGTLGPVGVWGEVTYGGPAKFPEPKEPNPLEMARVPLAINRPYLQAVIGGDYTFPLGQGLLAQIQYIYRGQGSLLQPYVMPDLATLEPGEFEGAHYLYGRLGYDFSPSSSAEVLILHGFKEEGGIVRPAYTYRFPNSVQVQLSLLRPYGDEGISAYGARVQLAVTYQF